MRDLPILFSAPMVRAILDGRKTVTRRIMKPQPFADGYYQGTVCLDVSGPFARFSVEAVGGGAFCTEERASPYGDPGDRLWVREAWRVPDSLDACSGFDIAEKCIEAGYRKPWAPIRYEADGALSSAKDWHEFGTTPGEATPGRYRHSRFMPRWASRLTLNVTDVRVERLQDIDYAQAIAEGIHEIEIPADECGPNRVGYSAWIAPTGPTLKVTPVEAFHQLWESINGSGSWDDNPWVWVVEFRRIEGGAR
jgi:hypothetical protein